MNTNINRFPLFYMPHLPILNRSFWVHINGIGNIIIDISDRKNDKLDNTFFLYFYITVPSIPNLRGANGSFKRITSATIRTYDLDDYGFHAKHRPLRYVFTCHSLLLLQGFWELT